MLLCIDIGNTNITLGMYEGAALGPRWRLATENERMPDEFGLQVTGLLALAGKSPADVNGVAIASVVPPLTSRWIETCRVYLKCDPLVVDAGVRTGVKIRYEDPRAVGADRIVDAAAAFRLYGGPACIVDFGTATTFDAISSEGEYLGGAIAPGDRDRGPGALPAHRQTSAGRPPPPARRHRPQHRQRDTIRACSSATSAWWKAWSPASARNSGREMKVIGTGGQADLIAHETRVIEILAPWLTLDGLRMIYEMNQ